MKTLWMILAIVGGACAVVFVFRGDYEKAFVAAAAGAVVGLAAAAAVGAAAVGG